MLYTGLHIYMYKQAYIVTYPRPVWAKLFHEISDIDSGSFSDGKDIIHQPLHAQCV